MQLLKSLVTCSLLVLFAAACSESPQNRATYQQENEDFLTENAKSDDWIVLESGLQYRILTEGDGQKPSATSRVKVHYEGKLTNGTVFDSSYDRGEPSTFGVNQVIAGWSEALQLMKEGSVWELAIPAYLAYGDADRGDIPAQSTLLFKVELLDVETQDEKAEKVKEEQAAYLAENAQKDGVIVTESGLQYRILTAGDGPTPAPTDIVTVHYEGKLIDGTVFDSSHKRGGPANFPANRLIKGWVEALQLMKKGAVWELVIPAELAYGDRERPNIPAHSTLTFKLELLDVRDPIKIVEEMQKEQVSYLEENAKKDGVTVTDSGLQYLILESGADGAKKPTDADTVTVHYEGRLIGGKVFDSSYERGEPTTFGLKQVIPGWTEALQLMKVGDKFEITLPHEIAYGANGVPGVIPSFATLVFQVELLDVVSAE